MEGCSIDNELYLAIVLIDLTATVLEESYEMTIFKQLTTISFPYTCLYKACIL